MDFSPYFCNSGVSFPDFGNDSNLLGMSLEEMIDHDINSDLNDINAGNFSSLDLLNFKFDDDLVMNSSTVNSGSSMFGHTFTEDINGASSRMVNPSNVMPLPRQVQHNIQVSVTRPFNQYLTIASPTIIGNLQSQQPTASSSMSPAAVRTIKIMAPVSSPHLSPLQQVPSPFGGPATSIHSAKKNPPPVKENGFPKPAYSYSCLIALALKNSRTGMLSVSEIYKFMCDHFPYFNTAPSGWKNSVRHNLSLNKSFEKIEKPATNGNQRKGCLWAMNPAKIAKMDEEVAKWSRKDPSGIKNGMIRPDTLEFLERGEFVKDYSSIALNVDSEDDDDPRTPASVSSQDSQGLDLADVEAFTVISDSSMPELNLQASGIFFEELESANPHIFHGNYALASLPSPVLKSYSNHTQQ